jgi:hypothetical protein
MVFGIIPECSSASFRMSVQLHRNPHSGNQYDWGLKNPGSNIEQLAPSWDEYELGLAPAAVRACGGEPGLFGLSSTSMVDLDYFDPTLFQ